MRRILEEIEAGRDAKFGVVVQENVGEFVDSSREGVVKDDRGFEEREVSFNRAELESWGKHWQCFAKFVPKPKEREHLSGARKISVFLCREINAGGDKKLAIWKVEESAGHAPTRIVGRFLFFLKCVCSEFEALFFF